MANRKQEWSFNKLREHRLKNQKFEEECWGCGGTSTPKCKLCKRTDANSYKRRSNSKDWFCNDCWKQSKTYTVEKERHCASCWEKINADMSDLWLYNKKTGHIFCDAACAYKYTLPKEVKAAHQAFSLSEKAIALVTLANCHSCSAKLKPKQGETEICHACKLQAMEKVCPFCPVSAAAKKDWRYLPCELHSLDEPQTREKLFKNGLTDREVELTVSEMKRDLRKEKRKEMKKELECANCYEHLPEQWKKNKKGEFLCNRCGIYEWRYGRPRPMPADGYFGVETLINPPCAVCETYTSQNWLVDSGKRTICSVCFLKNDLEMVNEEDIWQMNMRDCKKRLKLDTAINEKLAMKKEEAKQKLSSEEPIQSDEPVILHKEEDPEIEKAPEQTEEAKEEEKVDEEGENFEFVNKEDEKEEPEEGKGIVGTIASWMPFL